MRETDWLRLRVKCPSSWKIILLGCWLLAIAFLTGCREETPTPPPTDTETLPTNTPRPTPTPREKQQPTPTETGAPTAAAPQDPSALMPLPDFSAVQLDRLTYLDDPRYFQVTLDGWPQDVPEDVVVRVGNIIFTCQRLFPDQFPNRAYCWGESPPEGANVLLDVFSDRVADPLVEIAFTVPYIPRATQTPGN